MKELTEELKNNVLHSREAEEGAVSLLSRLENRELMLDLRTNGYKPVTTGIDEKDLLSYTSFLRSLKGHRLLKQIDIWDGEPVTEFLPEED